LRTQELNSPQGDETQHKQRQTEAKQRQTELLWYAQLVRQPKCDRYGATLWLWSDTGSKMQQLPENCHYPSGCSRVQKRDRPTQSAGGPFSAQTELRVTRETAKKPLNSPSRVPLQQRRRKVAEPGSGEFNADCTTRGQRPEGNKLSSGLDLSQATLMQGDMQAQRPIESKGTGACGPTVRQTSEQTAHKTQ
jgi:hypothetical protein